MSRIAVTTFTVFTHSRLGIRAIFTNKPWTYIFEDIELIDLGIVDGNVGVGKDLEPDGERGLVWFLIF
jgi:hypothetical protein